MKGARAKPGKHPEKAESPEYVISPTSPALCLDFVNTLSWRGSSPDESLRDISDLVRWCREASVLDEDSAHWVQAWAEREPKEAARMLVEARALRENIHRLFRGVAAGEVLPEPELARLNHSLSRAPHRVALDQSDGRLGWKLRLQPQAENVLAPVLWSAGDLVANLTSFRIRQCANPQCLWMFVDDSKNGSRRWCSMKYCGNRAKARRHYMRHRSHSPATS
jgi:predicted RNA-binding Zn ribbon-like protein